MKHNFYFKISIFLIIIYLAIACDIKSNQALDDNTSNQEKPIPLEQPPKYFEIDDPSFDLNTGEFIVDKYTAGLWHFNEGKDTIVFDSTKNDNYGEIIGCKWTEGIFDKGVLINKGSINIIDEKLSLSPSYALTIEIWTKIDDTIQYHNLDKLNLISKSGRTSQTDGVSYDLWAGNGYHPRYPDVHSFYWRLLIGGGVVYISSQVKWQSLKGNWHYLAGSYNGKKIKIYVDGVLKSERNAEGKLFRVNSFLKVGGHQYYGIVDELRISNVARSEKAILDYYQKAKKFIK